MECTIRPALEDDADEISAVILRTLRETNAKDYAREIIERVEHSFSPSAVLQLIGKRTVFVATIGSRVVGTASLDGSVVRTVFVAPDVQARGIGKLLMAEMSARRARETSLDWQSLLHSPPKPSTCGLDSGPCAIATMVMNARSSWSDHWRIFCRSG
jgi:L-amino acid N-acyltransferase YncA